MKKILFFITVFVMSMVIMPNVNAATVEELKSWGKSTKIEVTGDETSGYTLKLIGKAEQDIEIKGNKNVTIDLNGQELTNFTARCSVIYIEKGSTVTIIDSQNSGKIYLTKYDNNVPVIGNFGTLNLVGGTVDSTQEGSTGIMNNVGSILNISGGTIIADKQGGSDHKGAAGISNEGTATITGGEFIQNYEYSVILNAGDMTISGGEFKTGESGTHYSLITNDGVNINNNASLNIINGKFNSDLILNNVSGNTSTITGGNFKNIKGLDKYLAANLTFDEYGNIIEKPVTNTEKEKEEINPNTSDINVYLLLSLIAVSGIGITYTVKRRFN